MKIIVDDLIYRCNDILLHRISSFNDINGKVEIFMALALPDCSVFNFLEERKNTLV